MTGPDPDLIGTEHGLKHVGLPDDRLYRVGYCRDCGISLWSYTPKAASTCAELARNTTKKREAA